MVDFSKLLNKPVKQEWSSGHTVWRTKVKNEVVICKHTDAPEDTGCAACKGKGWYWTCDDNAEGGWASAVCTTCHGKPLPDYFERSPDIEPADPDYELFEDCD